MSQSANRRRASDLENGTGAIMIQTVADDCDRPEQLQPEPPEPQQNESSIFDGSSQTIFSTYSEIAHDEDNKMVERWQKDTKGILIFTGLFSASIAPFLTGSVQDLRPNPQDSSAMAFYLANIYQILDNSTISRMPTPSSVAKPPPFSPSRYAIWVNSLWFLSFVIALICAVLATLVQQWSRRYLRNTQPARCSPEKQARLRAFFVGGVDKMNVSMAVELLSILLHLSLILFLSGLVIYLHDVHHVVYHSVAWCVGIFLTVYAFTTFMPMFMPESPYNTPFTTPVVIICMTIYGAYFVACIVLGGCLLLLGGLLILCKRILRLLCCCNRPRDRREVGSQSGGTNSNVISLLRSQCEKYWGLFKQLSLRWYLHATDDITSSIYSRLMKSFWVKDAIEDANIFPLSKIDLGILVWSVGALGDDETLGKVVEAIPGFLSSQTVKDLKRKFPDHPKFIKSLGGSMGRTLLSNSVSEADKTRRLKICMDAADKMCDSRDIYHILWQLSRLPFDRAPQTIQTAKLFSQWCTNGRSEVAGDNFSKARRQIVASILPHVQNRDDSWIAFAREEFGLKGSGLPQNPHYVNHDDDGTSALLDILLHVIRNRSTNWDWGILSSLSRFDIVRADPRLKNNFCTLWNNLVREARERGEYGPPLPFSPLTPPSRAIEYSAINVLRQIRHLFIALHQGTDAAPTQFSSSTRSGNMILCLPSSYSSCNLGGHHPGPPSPPIPHVGPNDPFPHQSLPLTALESQPIHGDSTSQRT